MAWPRCLAVAGVDMDMFPKYRCPMAPKIYVDGPKRQNMDYMALKFLFCLVRYFHFQITTSSFLVGS